MAPPCSTNTTGPRTAGDQAIHGPKFDRTDVLVETELLDPGETWTIAVTPFAGGVGGTIYWSQAKIGDMST